MRSKIILALCGACLVSGASAGDLGFSIQFSQPGVYGRVDIGQYPQPQVIVSTPLMIEPPPPNIPPPQPVYLWVPPEHREHWDRNCREYHACGQPVYFVNHDWYQHNVVERDDERRHGRGRGHADEDHGQHRGHGHGDGDDERGHDHDRD